MTTEKFSRIAKSFSFSLDTWAVLIALAIALAVRFGLLKRVPW